MGLTHAFPMAETLLRGKLWMLGMPKKRGVALQGLTKAVAGQLSLYASQSADELYGELVAMPGIGPWTAQYVLMHGLSTPDAFPIDDLGLINALEGERYRGKKLLERAEVWRPWRAYATLHLWASLSD